MLESVLVANRGEIARRVIRTARTMGIRAVAVYSDADADLPFVGEADQAVRIGPAPPASSYLDVRAVLRAARTTGVAAIHPGYGFLSESAGFAAAVIDAGLTWIGPPPAAIAAMGSKVEAKRLMAAADVPVLRELAPADRSGRHGPEEHLDARLRHGRAHSAGSCGPRRTAAPRSRPRSGR